MNRPDDRNKSEHQLSKSMMNRFFGKNTIKTREDLSHWIEESLLSLERQFESFKTARSTARATKSAIKR